MKRLLIDIGGRVSKWIIIGIIAIIIILLVFLVIFVKTKVCPDLVYKNNNENSQIISMPFGEVQCLGGQEIVKLVPGQINTIYCGIKAPVTSDYTITITKIRPAITPEATVRSWIIGGDEPWTGTVAPEDDSVKKILSLQIPSNAPEGGIFVNIEAAKNGTVIYTQTLDFIIQREGLLKKLFCP